VYNEILPQRRADAAEHAAGADCQPADYAQLPGDDIALEVIGGGHEEFSSMRASQRGHDAMMAKRSRVHEALRLIQLIPVARAEAVDRLDEFLLVREVGLPGRLSAANWFILLTLTAQVIGLGVTEPLRPAPCAAGSTRQTNVRAAAAALRWVLSLSVAALVAFAYATSFGWAALALVIHGVLRGLYSPL
jgi:hypothetical protein